MRLAKRIEAFEKLGKIIVDVLDNQTTNLTGASASLANIISAYQYQNPWFTEDNVRMALRANASWLTIDNLTTWLAPYFEKINEGNEGKKVGVIMAGNIPMVGFHDFLCILLSGNIFIGKASDTDRKLLPVVAALLIEIEPEFKNYIRFEDGLMKNQDAYVATGSNNSSRYFEHYFAKYPNIIRKNRNSVAVISGDESKEDFKTLGDDIFAYFGLGCRNVSKFYVPENYTFDFFFEQIEERHTIIHHSKYNNNYTYQKAILLVNKVHHFDNGFLLLREENTLASPISTIHFEYYKNEDELNEKLEASANDIQCIVSNKRTIRNAVPFGKSQQPAAWDYADGVDTMEFLVDLQ